MRQDGVASWLCEACAGRKPGIQGLCGLVRSLKRGRKPSLTCPHCETTADDVKETGLAGCPLCYEALDDAWEHFGIVRGTFDTKTLELAS